MMREREGYAVDNQTVVIPLRRYAECSDEALVRAVLDGARGAAAALFDRHAPRIERLLYRILGPERDHADALNETFCRALERLDELVDVGGLGRWLVAIAVNVAREHLRSRRRRGWLEYRPPEALPEVVYEDAADAREAVRVLSKVLDGMPPDERLALVLRHFEGLALDEMASALDVSLATAKRHLAQAENRFAARTRREPALAPWTEGRS